MRFQRSYALIIVTALLVVSCGTLKKSKTEPEMPVAEPVTEFRPATSVSRIYHDTGSYANLYTPDTFAVWVSQEVASLKHNDAINQGDEIDPQLEAVAIHFCNDYLVFECHMASCFGDMSIAYDVVGFRGITAYLRLPDGTKIPPLQKLIDSEATEKQVDALKEFRRTNLLIFPRNVLPPASTPEELSLPKVMLVLEGINSRFFFEWPEVPIPVPSEEKKFKPAAQEAAKAVQLGFKDLFSRLQKLSHHFD